MTTIEILLEMQQAIAETSPKGIQTLPVDRWIALSALHKSIRRSDIETAQRAALTLLEQDRRSFWSRIAIIACEDIGVSSPTALTQTLTAANNPVWRKQVGDLKTALYLVRLLCESVKVRIADEMYSIVDRAPEHRQLRQSMGAKDDGLLANITLDVQKPLHERLLAIWYLIGTKRYPSDNLKMREGSFDMAVDTLRLLGAPHGLTESCIGTLKRSRHPLSLWTPLLWTELKRHPRTLITWSDRYQPSAVYQGVPLIALDGFTRIGKTSFRKLQTAVPALKPFTTAQIALCVFYVEGFHIDKRLTCLKLDEYRKAGEMADIRAVGLDIARYNDLIELVVAHADILAQIRKDELKGYLAPSEQQIGLMV